MADLIPNSVREQDLRNFLLALSEKLTKNKNLSHLSEEEIVIGPTYNQDEIKVLASEIRQLSITLNAVLDNLVGSRKI
jgi:hypothetical protein